MGIIYLIPCPIAEDSHSESTPEFNKKVIEKIDYFLVEDIRTSRRYISSLQLQKKVDELVFYKVNKDTSAIEIKSIIEPLPKDSNIGIMSEAGCPGIADPGSKVVAYAHQIGWQVHPLVGPSSILMALMSSGFSGQAFTFHGYLPIEKEKRIKTIKHLEKKLIETQYTQIFMETPYRNQQLLTDLLELCNTNTKLCIVSNVSSISNEKIISQSIKDWKKKPLPNYHKSPCIFLIGEF